MVGEDELFGGSSQIRFEAHVFRFDGVGEVGVVRKKVEKIDAYGAGEGEKVEVVRVGVGGFEAGAVGVSSCLTLRDFRGLVDVRVELLLLDVIFVLCVIFFGLGDVGRDHLGA